MFSFWHENRFHSNPCSQQESGLFPRRPTRATMFHSISFAVVRSRQRIAAKPQVKVKEISQEHSIPNLVRVLLQKDLRTQRQIK
jgi:hypothetical protein